MWLYCKRAPFCYECCRGGYLRRLIWLMTREFRPSPRILSLSNSNRRLAPLSAVDDCLKACGPDAYREEWESYVSDNFGWTGCFKFLARENSPDPEFPSQGCGDGGIWTRLNHCTDPFWAHPHGNVCRKYLCCPYCGFGFGRGRHHCLWCRHILVWATSIND